jgi:hypothetical protein
MVADLISRFNGEKAFFLAVSGLAFYVPAFSVGRDNPMEVNTMIPDVPRQETREAVGAGMSSGVSWGAVIGGAFVAAALSLVLFALGVGLGLSSVSPWSNVGEASAATLGTVAIVWLLITEIIASAMGGYLTGRLRIMWAVLHTDEVYFRDTANGFLSWAVALVLTATFLGTAAASMAGGAARGTVEAAGTTVGADPNAYFVDMLFRSEGSAASNTEQTGMARAEVARSFNKAFLQDETAAADKAALAKMVAARTGMSLPEADQRVSQVLLAVRQAADSVRKATARLLLWSFLALMMGAFSASYAATIGGRQRDHVKPV